MIALWGGTYVHKRIQAYSRKMEVLGIWLRGEYRNGIIRRMDDEIIF